MSLDWFDELSSLPLPVDQFISFLTITSLEVWALSTAIEQLLLVVSPSWVLCFVGHPNPVPTRNQLSIDKCAPILPFLMNHLDKWYDHAHWIGAHAALMYELQKQVGDMWQYLRYLGWLQAESQCDWHRKTPRRNDNDPDIKLLQHPSPVQSSCWHTKR